MPISVSVERWEPNLDRWQLSKANGLLTLANLHSESSHMSSLARVCVCVCVCVRARTHAFSHVQLFAAPWTVVTRLICSWNFSGKNTGVGCHFLFQGIIPTQGSNPHLLGLLYWKQILDHWATEKVSCSPLKTLPGCVSVELSSVFSAYWDSLLKTALCLYISI